MIYVFHYFLKNIEIAKYSTGKSQYHTTSLVTLTKVHLSISFEYKRSTFYCLLQVKIAYVVK